MLEVVRRRKLEHSTIPAMVKQVFKPQPVTVRDSSVVGVKSL
jgi:hypothetical protein